MTKINIPINYAEEAPDEAVYFDKLYEKTYQKPPRTSVATLYRQHTLLIGIVVGALVMGVVAVYFQSQNFGELNNKITRNAELGGIMEKNTSTIKNLIEKNAGMLEEYKANNTTILSEIENKITRKTARVLEDKKEIVGQP